MVENYQIEIVTVTPEQASEVDDALYALAQRGIYVHIGRDSQAVNAVSALNPTLLTTYRDNRKGA